MAPVLLATLGPRVLLSRHEICCWGPRETDFETDYVHALVLGSGSGSDDSTHNRWVSSRQAASIQVLISTSKVDRAVEWSGLCRFLGYEFSSSIVRKVVNRSFFSLPTRLWTGRLSVGELPLLDLNFADLFRGWEISGSVGSEWAGLIARQRR